MNNRLKVLRAERGWSQQDLAERLEVSRQSVNAIETGKYDPSLPLAFRIADVFELMIEQVFLRKAAHRHGPFDRRGRVAAEDRLFRSAADRDTIEVDVRRKPAVQPQFLPAVVRAALQRAEVQKAEIQRFLDLQRPVAREEDTGDVRVQSADGIGSRVEFRVRQRPCQRVEGSLGAHGLAGSARSGAHSITHRISRPSAPTQPVAPRLAAGAARGASALPPGTA